MAKFLEIALTIYLTMNNNIYIFTLHIMMNFFQQSIKTIHITDIVNSSLSCLQVKIRLKCKDLALFILST